MKRIIFVALAAVSAILALLAVMAALGFVSKGVLWVHSWPAAAIYSAASEMGFYLSPHGVLIRSAHGPPFLGPLGIAIVYGVPAFVFAFLAFRHRSQ